MIGEGCCQWPLLAKSSHPVIWINLGLIGTTALESGEKQIHLSSATLPPPPDGRRAVGEQEVKPLCRHLNPPLHSSSFRPFNFCCGYCPRPHLSQPALKYLCLSIVKEVKKLRRRARVGGVSSISGAIESRAEELSRCRVGRYLSGGRTSPQSGRSVRTQRFYVARRDTALWF